MLFTNAYEHSIDKKNRLSIPAEVRAELDPQVDGKRFYLVPGRPPTTIWIYTERMFEAIAARFSSDLLGASEVLSFEQRVFPHSVRVEPDSHGRILIPERMLKQSGLDRDVVLVGVRDHMEIRRRDEWEREQSRGWNDFAELHLKAREAQQKSAEKAG